MNITFSYNPQSFGMTPTALLDKCSKGEHPKYEHYWDYDKLQCELDDLADRYRSDLSLRTKKQILKKEQEILFQELRQPQLTLARNYEEIMDIMPEDIRGKEFTDALRLFSINGIERVLALNFNKVNDKEIDTLKDVYLELDENTKTGQTGKNMIIDNLGQISAREQSKKRKVDDILHYLYENTENEKLKKRIITETNHPDHEKIMEDFHKNPDNNNLFKKILTSSRVNDESVTQQVNSILKSDNAPKDIMRSAILGAGKFRSDENFEIIKEIALNKDEKDIRKREFAIHSTALYLKEKPEEVNAIMDEIKNDGTIFSPLATIIKDKITGNYHGQKHREVNYAGLSPEESNDFLHGIQQLISCKHLNQQQKNTCERSIIPFIEHLQKINASNHTFYLSNDTYSRFETDSAGLRYFEKDNDLSNSGEFNDSIDGANTDDFSMMMLSGIKDGSHNNSISHELGHLIEHLYPEVGNKINSLYENAMEKHIALNDYAETCASEYFASGCDAYASTYIPHSWLLIGDITYVHSKYDLMDRDPDLYNYIDNLLKGQPKGGKE